MTSNAYRIMVASLVSRVVLYIMTHSYSRACLLCVSYPPTFVPSPIHGTHSREPDQLSDAPYGLAKRSALLEPPVQKPLCLDEVVAFVVRHEDLAGGVDGAQRCAFSVPGAIDASVRCEIPDFIRQSVEFEEGRADVGWAGH